jgi:hypothetical protein
LKPTQKDKIRERLKTSPQPFLAVHELGLIGASKNSAATRLSEMAKAGEVVGRYRKNANYKEFCLRERLPIEQLFPLT